MLTIYSISLIVLVYGALYFIFCLSLFYGINRLKPRPLPDELPSVSVVVCARNEEKNIGRCLSSLSALDYPRDRLEIIVVDDESEDRTREIMNEYAGKNECIRVLSAEERPRDLPAKQRPLDMGIEAAKGKFIFITDADIALDPGWISGHLASYDDQTGVTGGTTRIDTSSGKLYDYLQSCDLVTKHAVAMGCAGLGFPLTLMGNNMTLRRDAYDRVGGIRGLSGSLVEDMAMMNAVVSRTPYTMKWASHPASVVVSLPEKDLGTFVRQRMRWIHEMTDLSTIGKVTITAEVCMLVAFFAALAVAPWNYGALIGVAGAWFGGYAVLLLSLPGHRREDLLFVPAMIVFQIMYGVVLGFRRLTGARTVVWKGRVYSGNAS